MQREEITVNLLHIIDAGWAFYTELRYVLLREYLFTYFIKDPNIFLFHLVKKITKGFNR